MATTSGPSSYWKESSGSLRLSGGCGNWLGVSNHPPPPPPPPPLPKHTHTHTHTHTNNAEEHTDNFYLELNVMDRILILVQMGLHFVVW